MSSLTLKIEIQCRACSGSGVYRGIAEAPGIGIVCRDCKGSGKRTHEYVPFTGLTKRNDVEVVCAERGDFHIPDSTSGIPYAAFLQGKLPEPRLEFQDV